MKVVLQSIRMLVILSIITGIVYPFVMTGLAQALLSRQANGSMVVRDGQPIGSNLVGQNFSSDKYFWPRPSGVGYSPLPSSGTNLGPTSAVLRDSVAARAARLGKPIGEIPADLLEASGSGLDPHISPEAAEIQVDRVLTARGFPLSLRNQLQTFVKAHIEMPQLGVLGEERINILQLNMDLDTLRLQPGGLR